MRSSSLSIIIAGSVLLSVFSISSSSSCKLEVKLKQVLRNEGFHRNLTYSILLKEDGELTETYHNCWVAVEQSLPPGVFVNPDELADLKRVGKLDVLAGAVDVELPAERARRLTAVARGRAAGGRAKLWLPLHARYRAAAPAGGFGSTVLPEPRVYLRCGPAVCAEAELSAATFGCGGDSAELCRWSQVDYSLTTATPQWRVPVGNTNDSYIVATGTTVAIVLGSLYILKAMHDYKTSGKKTA